MRTGLSMGGGVTGGLVSLVLFLHFVPLCADATHLSVCALCAFQGGCARKQILLVLVSKQAQREVRAPTQRNATAPGPFRDKKQRSSCPRMCFSSPLPRSIF